MYQNNMLKFEYTIIMLKCHKVNIPISFEL